MWKLSQEEAWQADLRGREANHMSQLAAEWHRRDQQRQQLLREKVSKRGGVNELFAVDAIACTLLLYRFRCS